MIFFYFNLWPIKLEEEIKKRELEKLTQKSNGTTIDEVEWKHLYTGEIDEIYFASNNKINF